MNLAVSNIGFFMRTYEDRADILAKGPSKCLFLCFFLAEEDPGEGYQQAAHEHQQI
jgi:hypothetical protein